jgi:integrase
MGVTVREKVKDSGVWWVFVNHEGRRKSKKVGDRQRAEEIAEKVNARIVLGEFGLKGEKEDKPEAPLFRDHARLWLALAHDWKESTRESYQELFRLHVLPVLGGHRLDNVSRKHVKALFDKLLAQGKAPSTVGVIRAALSGFFNHALDSELIEVNPVQGLKTGAKKEKTREQIDPLTGEEAHKLLEQAKTYRAGAFYPVILCGLRTGMRLGEMQALAEGDIDFNGRFIEVRHSCRRGRLTSTKNKHRRRVDMTPHVVETLKAVRVTHKKRALKNGMPLPRWIFADVNGNMFDRETLRRALRKCLKLAGLREIRVHDLRHSYATIRLMKGHNIGDVSYQLGHSSISITYDIYGHWVPGKFKSEVDELDGPHLTRTYLHPEKEATENVQYLH